MQNKYELLCMILIVRTALSHPIIINTENYLLRKLVEQAETLKKLNEFFKDLGYLGEDRP